MRLAGAPAMAAARQPEPRQDAHGADGRGQRGTARERVGERERAVADEQHGEALERAALEKRFSARRGFSSI